MFLILIYNANFSSTNALKHKAIPTIWNTVMNQIAAI
jgi:hypothetical protein